MNGPEQFRVRLSEGRVAVVELDGDVDATAAPALRACLGALVEAGQSIVVDLARVEFVDSLGIGVFVYAHRRAAEHGRSLRLARPSPGIARVLALTGLGELIGADGASGIDA